MKKYLIGFLSGVILSAIVFALLKPKTEKHQYIKTKKIFVNNKVCPKNIVAEKKESKDDEHKKQKRKLASVKLSPPIFHPDMPEILETRKPGEVKMMWLPVEGAARYKVYLYDKKDEEVKEVSTRKSYIYLQNIPFKGTRKDEVLEYWVQIASGTKDGTYFEKGKRRKLLVYRDHLGIFNNLVAPGIKAIVTED